MQLKFPMGAAQMRRLPKAEVCDVRELQKFSGAIEFLPPFLFLFWRSKKEKDLDLFKKLTQLLFLRID